MWGIIFSPASQASLRTSTTTSTERSERNAKGAFHHVCGRQIAPNRRSAQAPAKPARSKLRHRFHKQKRNKKKQHSIRSPTNGVRLWLCKVFLEGSTNTQSEGKTRKNVKTENEDGNGNEWNCRGSMGSEHGLTFAGSDNNYMRGAFVSFLAL